MKILRFPRGAFLCVLLTVLVVLAMYVGRASAQSTANGVYNVTQPTLQDGGYGSLQLGSRGALITSLAAANGSSQVSATGGSSDDNSANFFGINTAGYNLLFDGTTWDRVRSVSGAGAAGDGTGVQAVGALGQYNATLPTLTDTQFGRMQLDSNGNLRTDMVAATVTAADDTANNAIFVPYIKSLNTATVGAQTAAGFLFDGTAWDRARSVDGANPSGGSGIAATGIMPTNHAGQGLAPSANTAVGSSRVLKASTGNLYSVNVVAGASAGFVLIYNATAAPADGAVTPVHCIPVAANGVVDKDFGVYPANMSTGITVAFSTTGCFTQTLSATAFISGRFR